MKIGDIAIGDGAPLAFICGPCVIEDNIFEIAETLADLPIIFKASFDKANRTKVNSYRGPGLEEGLRVLEEIRDQFGLPIYTDVHTPEQARAAGEVCDAIQIPAFLARQTDLLIAAGKTGKPVGVKKGQFMAPWDMKHVVEKIRSTGNDQILLIERGTCFGYNNLVVDFRSIPIMQGLGCPVCFDATHSTQLPSVGGQAEYAPLLARAAVAVGADALFIETHPSPADALSDSTTQIDFETLRELISQMAYA